jgi:hypothetical protein
MTNKMKILLAYDGSEYADAALADLQRAGLPADAQARVVVVDEQWLPGAASHWMVGTIQLTNASEDAQTLAQRAVACVRELFPTWEVEAEVRNGTPASSLLAAAEAWSPDLLVIGSRGRTGLVKFLLGSVSQKVLHHAPCSVRVAREQRVPMERPIEIIVGLDGSPGAAAAARAVANRAWPPGTEVLLLSAVPGFPLVSRAHTLKPMTEWIQEERLRIHSLTARLEQELSAAGLKVRSLLREGDAKTVLLEEAEKLQADCLFVGSTGMSAMDRFLLGSVSGAVAERASCSVEIVKVANTPL